jgi:hypothetical protein
VMQIGTNTSLEVHQTISLETHVSIRRQEETFIVVMMVLQVMSMNANNVHDWLAVTARIGHVEPRWSRTK